MPSEGEHAIILTFIREHFDSIPSFVNRRLKEFESDERYRVYRHGSDGYISLTKKEVGCGVVCRVVEVEIFPDGRREVLEDIVREPSNSFLSWYVDSAEVDAREKSCSLYVVDQFPEPTL